MLLILALLQASSTAVPSDATVRRPRIKSSGPRSVMSEADWVTSDDYPSPALREERQGVTDTRLHIDRSGRVRRCSIRLSSGHSDLDRAACRALTERARFAPAYDEHGDAITAVYPKRVRWVLPPEDATHEAVEGAMAEAGIRMRVRHVSYVVATDGAISECVEETQGNVPEPAPFLTCDSLGDSQLPIIDEQGNAVRRRVVLSASVLEMDPDAGAIGFIGKKTGED